MNYLQLVLLITSSFLLQETFCIHVRVYVKRNDKHFNVNLEETASVGDLYLAIADELGHETVDMNMVLNYRGSELSDKTMYIAAAGIPQMNRHDVVEVIFYVHVPVTRNDHSYMIKIKEDAQVNELYKATFEHLRPSLYPNKFDAVKIALTFRQKRLTKKTDRTMSLLAAGITQPHNSDVVYVSVFVTIPFFLMYESPKTKNSINVEERSDINLLFQNIADILDKEPEDIELQFNGSTFNYYDHYDQLFALYPIDVRTSIIVKRNQVVHLYIEEEHEYNNEFYPYEFDENARYMDIITWFHKHVPKHAHLAPARHVLLNVDNEKIQENDTLVNQNVHRHDSLYIVPKKIFEKKQYVEVHVEGESEPYKVRYYHYTTPWHLKSWIIEHKPLHETRILFYTALDKNNKMLEEHKKIIEQGVKSEDIVYLCITATGCPKRQMDAGESSRGTKKSKGKGIMKA